MVSLGEKKRKTQPIFHSLTLTSRTFTVAHSPYCEVARQPFERRCFLCVLLPLAIDFTFLYQEKYIELFKLHVLVSSQPVWFGIACATCDNGTEIHFQSFY